MSIQRNAVFLTAGMALLMAGLTGSALAQDVGDTVLREGRISENYYAAGGTVRVRAQVAGDVVVAGGVVDVEGEVSGNSVVAGGEVRLVQRVKGDLFAAAGSLEVRGDYADDARIAGGEVTVYARVAGDLIAAGGRVNIAPGSRVGGRAAFAGGNIKIDGTLEKRLLAAGGTVSINGVVEGDVDVEAKHLVLGPTARIGGSLSYRSPNAAKIDPAAKVAGKVEHIVSPIRENLGRAWWIGRFVLALALTVKLLVIGAGWFGLFPAFSRAAPDTLASSPLRSLLTGIVVVAGAPLAGVGLAATVVGLPLAGMLLFLYPPTLALGLVTAAFWLGDWGLRRMNRPATTGARLLALLSAAAIMGVLVLVPYLGPLALIAALLFGTGALWLRLLRADAGR